MNAVHLKMLVLGSINLQDISFLISVLSGCGYLYYFLLLKVSSTPYNRNYTMLFDRTYFLIQLAIAILMALLGMYRALYVDAREVFYLSPLVFLILFAVFNIISRLLTGEDTLL